LPIYEYYCNYCNLKFEKIEPVTNVPIETLNLKKLYCNRCGTYSVKKLASSFKIGTGILETTGKSGYLDDDLTLGKLIDEGGIPAEEKRRLRERDAMISRQKQYAKELKAREKKYNFNSAEEDYAPVN
jgi:putative FmdB family regulatory protein